MKLFGRDLDREIAVVAELGVNHEGNEAKAAAMIEAAAAAGADAVKLQTYTPEKFTAAEDPERLARVTRFALDTQAHHRLAALAAGKGINLFSTAVTEDVVPLLAELFPVVKIASGDLTFEPVIRAAAASGRQLIISTGNGTTEEIDAAVNWCRDCIGETSLRERVVLMHCVSAYPAPIEEANLLSIPFLRQRYGLTIGYSNHVIGSDAVLAAVALGAQVLEVHITDCKSGRQFRDHALSFEPDELANLVQSARRVRSSLGVFGKVVQPSERAIRDAMRKGVVAARDLTADSILRAEDLMYARPATEFAASELASLVGRRLTQSVKRGHLVPRSAIVPAVRSHP